MTASEGAAPPPGAERRTGLDRLLDLAVYGPVGLALAARDLLPELADRGRRQLEARFVAAGMVGRLAVKEGTRQADQAVRRLTDQAEALARSAGLVPPVTTPPVPADDTGGGQGEGAAPDDAPAASTAAADPEAPPLDPATLSIPGYDTLSASQVVQRLPGLSAEELEAVRDYELAGRARKTILHRVAQLRAAL
ncbi:MAG TPA: hypothetical protein VHF24_12425 [Acidimicrobiales bacterium]|nr:hypothetical protein [Acidimicrobiales bacterium]